MNEMKRPRVFNDKSILRIQIFATIIALILFIYLNISDNMVVFPFFLISLSLCFIISGFRLYRKNRTVTQKVIFYIVGITLFIIALQDLLQ